MNLGEGIAVVEERDKCVLVARLIGSKQRERSTTDSGYGIPVFPGQRGKVLDPVPE